MCQFLFRIHDKFRRINAECGRTSVRTRAMSNWYKSANRKPSALRMSMSAATLVTSYRIRFSWWNWFTADCIDGNSNSNSRVRRVILSHCYYYISVISVAQLQECQFNSHTYRSHCTEYPERKIEPSRRLLVSPRMSLSISVSVNCEYCDVNTSISCWISASTWWDGRRKRVNAIETIDVICSSTI